MGHIIPNSEEVQFTRCPMTRCLVSCSVHRKREQLLKQRVVDTEKEKGTILLLMVRIDSTVGFPSRTLQPSVCHKHL